jgi:hypothetical protein
MEDLLYDALEWKLNEFYDGFKKRYPNPTPPAVKDLFPYITEDPTFFKVMLHYIGTIKGYELSQQVFKDLVSEHFSHLQLSVPEEVIRHHVSGVFFNLIRWWFKPGNDVSPEVMTNYFRELVFDGLFSIVGVSTNCELYDVIKQAVKTDEGVSK